ncbi:MAG: SAM-dependent methyltransferase [Chloroflexota bacterium]
MIAPTRRAKIEYGDFQTPLELARLVCQKLEGLGVSPDVIIEPTCGVGAFVEAAAHQFSQARKIIGVEVNQGYLDKVQARKPEFPANDHVTLKQGNFFDFDWKSLFEENNGSVLVIGNFPWVTNAQQGMIGGTNLPDKSNFQNHNGFDAITGKSNFDISEWMLIQVGDWLQNRKGYLAMLCKTTVARKVLSHLHAGRKGLFRSAIYGIDAKKHFGASVEACLLFCEFDGTSHNYDYDIYERLESVKAQRVGHRKGMTIRDLDTFERLGNLFDASGVKWRSGVKHDCSEVMELTERDGILVNGAGEKVDVESAYVYPLLKGSDVANGRIETTNRFVIVTQKVVGEPTHTIKHLAPKTWKYLESHAQLLDNRRSRIYQDNPRFSIFGVGAYSFSPYKIAICGLYKKLEFNLVGEIEGKPVLFDDTVYFLSFDAEEEARKTLYFLSTQSVHDFYSSMIFWDEKRPIKTSILNSLNLQKPQTVQALRLFEKETGTRARK